MRNNPFLQQAAEEDDFPTCPGCKKQVYPSDRPLMALGGKWHPGCLKCTTCKLQLTPRNLESWQNQPYCKAHVPSAKHTQVSNDFHTKQALSRPEVERRQHGVDVTARKSFATGNLANIAEKGADAGKDYGGGKADSGEFIAEARSDHVAQAGVSWGKQDVQSGTWEVAPRVDRVGDAGKDWGKQEVQSGTWESNARESNVDAGKTWGGQKADEGEYSNAPQTYEQQGFAHHEGQTGGGGNVYKPYTPPPNSGAPKKTPRHRSVVVVVVVVEGMVAPRLLRHPPLCPAISSKSSIMRNSNKKKNSIRKKNNIRKKVMIKEILVVVAVEAVVERPARLCMITQAIMKVICHFMQVM